MSRQQYNDGQEIVFEDFNKIPARVEQELYDRVIYELLQRAEDSFFSDSFLTSYASPTSVTVNSGVGFQTDVSVDSHEPQKRLLYRGTNVNLNLTAPDTVNDRIDIVVCKALRVDGDTESRKFKDASTSVISNQNLVISNDWEAELLIVDGTPAGSPVAPAVPAGYIKIAELDVSAVTGLSGAGAVADSRSLMPLGSSSPINSSAFVRLTQSASLPMQTAFEEVDALLKNGLVEDNIFDDIGSDPAAPGTAGQVKLYNKGGLLYIREQAGTVTPVGSGGGGGGAGAKWEGDALEAEEFGQTIKQFAAGGGAKETLYLRVPDGYLSGRQISSFLGAYSPSASDDWKLQIVSSLIRKGQDAIDSTANQETNDSGDITNDQANEYREVSINISDATGQINGFAVSPGDLIRLDLTRAVPAGTDDSEELRFIPSATEIKFG